MIGQVKKHGQRQNFLGLQDAHYLTHERLVRIDVGCISDPGQQMARRFNARWLPRAYAFDEDGRLTYVQPDTVGDTDAPKQVGALWQHGQ